MKQDQIQTMVDEIERLRDALEKIAYAPKGKAGPTLRESIEIARAALKGAPEP